MATKTANSMEVLGARFLREVEVEEGSLEDLLTDLRTSLPTRRSQTGLPSLDHLLTHQPKPTISGRGLPLLYHLITYLINTLSGTIALLDLTSRFSPSHLLPRLAPSDLEHIHVFFSTQSNLRATLDSLENYMLYGNHKSKGREWVGTIVFGGMGGDINFGWRGWLRVEREEFGGVGEGVSAEEAWEGRERFVEETGKRGWRGVCEEGEFVWGSA